MSIEYIKGVCEKGNVEELHRRYPSIFQYANNANGIGVLSASFNGIFPNIFKKAFKLLVRRNSKSSFIILRATPGVDPVKLFNDEFGVNGNNRTHKDSIDICESDELVLTLVGVM